MWYKCIFITMILITKSLLYIKFWNKLLTLKKKSIVKNVYTNNSITYIGINLGNEDQQESNLIGVEDNKGGECTIWYKIFRKINEWYIKPKYIFYLENLFFLAKTIETTLKMNGSKYTFWL